MALLPGDSTRTHGERLPGEIACVLEMASIAKEQIDLLAVATGPGAFTGLRIGLAAMQGLAMTLNKPVVGVSALDALALQVARADVEIVAPWMDAQRGDVFATLIERSTHSTLEPPAAANPAALLDAWQRHLGGRRTLFVGDAAARDAQLIAQRGEGRWLTQLPSELAPQIAAIARERAARGEAGSPHKLEPIYVRRPDAEIERERRSQRGADDRR